MSSRDVPMPRCSTCGAEIPAEAPAGWCPACLFRGALDPDLPPAPEPPNPPPSLSPPSSLSRVPARLGDYELLDAIAHGGMGVVHRARQIRLDRIVALKLLLGGQYASDEARRRFRDEAQAAARLSHPGIVPVYDVGEHQGQLYYSMELILDTSGRPAPTLADRVALEPLAPDQAVAYLLAVTAAVANAHQNGILHRDLKPSNVLLAADDRPRITDFGLARPLEPGAAANRTVSGQVLGTPGYLSPEQVTKRFGPVTVRTDIYALGAIFYCLLTGRPPIEGGGITLDDLQRAAETDPRPPRELNPRIPRDHEVVCLTCLAKEPGCRYPDAAALLRDLEHLQRGEPPERRPISRATRLWYRARRKPVVASLTVALGLVLGLGVPLVLFLRSDGHTHAQRAKRERTTGILLSANAAIDAGQLPEALHLLAAGLREVPRQRALADRFVQLIDDHAFLLPMAKQGAPAGQWTGQELTPGLARSAGGQWIAEITNRVDILLRATADPTAAHLLAAAHTKAIRSVSFNRDGTRLVSASADRTARVWELRTASPSLEAMESNPPSRLTPAVPTEPGPPPDFLGAERGGARVATLQPLRILAHPDRVLHAVFHPEGSAVATACADGQVRLWPLERSDSPPRVLVAHPSAISCVRFSPDGRLLAVGTDDGVVSLWDASDGTSFGVPRRLASANPPANPVPVVDVECATDPPGLRALVTGVGVCAFRLSRPGALGDPDRIGSEAVVGPSGRKIPQGLLDRLHLPEISASLGSVDGRTLAVAVGTQVRLYDERASQPTVLALPHAERVRLLAFSPDGLRLATGTEADRVRVWDVETGQPVTPSWEAGRRIQAIRFDRTRRLLLTDEDGPFWALAACPHPIPEWLPYLAEVLVGPGEKGGMIGRRPASLDHFRARVPPQGDGDDFADWVRRSLALESGPDRSP